MKKLLTTLLIVFCICGLLVLTACTEEKTNTPDQTVQTTEKPADKTTEKPDDETAEPGGSEDDTTAAEEDPLYDPVDWSKNY